MEVSWELLVLVWCLLVGNPCAGVSPPSSQHLLCTWCLPGSRGGRGWVWIHQGGSCDLPGILYSGQPLWRFNCVLETVPMGYTCTIKIFPGPKGKWQGMAHIWIEELSILKQAAKSLAVLSPGPCQGGEQTKTSLEILLVTTSVQFQASAWALYFINTDISWIWSSDQRVLLIIILAVPLCLFFSLSEIKGYGIHEPGMLKNIPAPNQHSFIARKGYGAAKKYRGHIETVWPLCVGEWVWHWPGNGQWTLNLAPITVREQERNRGEGCALPLQEKLPYFLFLGCSQIFLSSSFSCFCCHKVGKAKPANASCSLRAQDTATWLLKSPPFAALPLWERSSSSMYLCLGHSEQENVSSLILMTLSVISQPTWKEKRLDHIHHYLDWRWKPTWANLITWKNTDSSDQCFL